MQDTKEAYDDDSARSLEDLPAWLFPVVIAGGTAVVVLALVVMLATWGLVRRREPLAAAPVPSPLAQRTNFDNEPDVVTVHAVSETPAGLVDPTGSEDQLPVLPEKVPNRPPTPDSLADGVGNQTGTAVASATAATEEVTPPTMPTTGSASRDLGASSGESSPGEDRAVAATEPRVASVPDSHESVVREVAKRTTVVAKTGRRSVGRPSRPDAGTLDAAKQELADRGDEDGARTITPTAKRAVVESLLNQAKDQEDENLRYAMLDRARVLAMETGDIRLPFAAIQQMERAYEMDPLPLKVDTLERLAARVQTGHDGLRLAHLASDLGGQASDADQFDTARRLVDMGLNFARGLQDPQLQRTMAEQSKQLSADTARWQVAADARKVLVQNVDDAGANLTLGKYLCFVKENWDAGLAHLVQSSDSVLAEIAEREAAGPTEAKQLTRLADAWYDWGRKAKDQEQREAWSRARQHYQVARPDLAGTARRTVDQRLEELARALDGDRTRAAKTVRFAWLDGPAGQLQTFDERTENITALAVSAHGILLASSAEDRSVCLWHLPTGKRYWRHATETGNLNGIAITPDEQFVISNHDNNQLVVLSVADGKPVNRIPTSARSPTDLLVAPDGESLIWAARARPPNMLMWSLSHNRPLAQFGDGEYPSVIDISSDGQFIATGDSRGVVRLWDTAAGIAVRDLAVHQDAITDIDLSPGGDLVACATFDKIDVRDLDTGESVLVLEVPSIRTVAFAPDGLRLVSGGFREEVLMWEVATGRQLASLRAERAFSDRHILRIAFLPDPRGLVTGATDGKIRLWRLPD